MHQTTWRKFLRLTLLFKVSLSAACWYIRNGTQILLIFLLTFLVILLREFDHWARQCLLTLVLMNTEFLRPWVTLRKDTENLYGGNTYCPFLLQKNKSVSLPKLLTSSCSVHPESWRSSSQVVNVAFLLQLQVSQGYKLNRICLCKLKNLERLGT